MSGINKIANIRVYLSGAMEQTKDYGSGWRLEVTAELIKIGMNPNNILDPISDRTGKTPIKEEVHRIKLFKDTNNYRELKELSKTIIRHDLRMVDISDALILGIISCDNKFPSTFGTTHEIITAVEQHKPIFIYTNLSYKDFPLWLLGLLPDLSYWTSTAEELAQLIYRDVEENINKESKWIIVQPIS